MADKTTLEELQKEASAFRDSFKTVILSTVSFEGQPEASYAPYVLDEEGAMYIFTSELAAHTRNLLRHPLAGMMFIANEVDAKNFFARKRLSLRCRAVEVPRLSGDWEQILNLFEQVFGNTIGLLKTLPDFHLFQMEVIGGNYIRGFAQAFVVKGNELEILGSISGTLKK